MNIKYLDYFTQIVECENYATVSRKNYISQPGLHKAMRSLENMVGTSLLEQRNRKTQATPAGERMYPLAKKICQDYKTLMLAMQDFAEECDQGIRLGICSPAIDKVLSEYILTFMEHNLDCYITMIPQKENCVLRNLSTDQIDFAIFISPKDDDLDEFHICNLGSFTWGVIATDDSPLTSQESISLCDLAGYTVIMPLYRNYWTDYIRNMFDNSGLSNEDRPTYLMLPDSMWAKSIHREKTIYFDREDKWCRANHVDGTRYFPIQGSPFRFSYLLAYRKGKRLTVAEKQFWMGAKELEGKLLYRPH